MKFSHAVDVVLGASIAASCVAAAKIPKNAAPSVKIHQGLVVGSTDDSGNSKFLGIPFAETTGGENRWKAPKQLSKKSEKHIINATSYGPTCPQAITSDLYSRQDEDCLNLNVWAPAKGKNLPVFVYMYGGAMVTGSSSNPQFQGNTFARKDVVFVSFNTRESIWAYPNSAELTTSDRENDTQQSQNFGILDVEAALDWIHENIAAFGGNPDHIVFGGHSSGSVQVDHYLWNNPATWLKGAVQMSANAESGPAVAPQNQALDIVAAEVGCPTGKGQLACMRNISIYDIQTANFNSTYNTWFAPAIDNITRHSDYAARFAAGKYASHVPLLTGNDDGEGAIFALVYGSENTNFSSWINTFDADVAHIPDATLEAAYNASLYSSISAISGAQYGDARFFCPVDYLLDLRSQKQDTWFYRFFGNYSNVVSTAINGPTHGTEIPFFLGGNECFDSLDNVTEAQQKLADEINDWFVRWIKDPSAGPGWEKVRPKNGTLALLGVPGNELAVEIGATGHYNSRCQSVYDPLQPRYPVIQNVTALS